jgi:hypothetical protein
MSVSPSFGRLAPAAAAAESPTAATPFRIAYLADFSGRRNRGARDDSAAIAERAAVRIQRDDFDEQMVALEPRLSLPVPSKKGAEDVQFASLDDFGADELWDKVDPLFKKLGDDAKRAAQMHAFLHDVDFQTVESAWRGVDWLLRRVAKDDKVEVVLYDVSLEELAADLVADEDLAKSGLHELLVRKASQGKKGKPWALFVADYPFAATAEHAALLGRLAKIGAAAGAPFFVGSDPRLLDEKFKSEDDFAATWSALRALPEAAYLVVGASRFVLRQPYGAKNRPLEKFRYEEMSNPPKTDEHLWGSPGLACAALVALGFVEKGWAATPGALKALGKMPMHVYDDEGETTATLTEAWLERKQLQKLTALGLCPFVATKGGDQIQAATLTSVAGGPIAGRWAGGAAPRKAEKARPSIEKPAIRLTSAIPEEDDSPAAETETETEVESLAESEPMEASSAEPEAPAEDAAAETAEEATAASSETADDGDLDALLKSLESDAEAPAEPEAAEAEGDADLDALLKSLEEPPSENA